MKKMFLLAFVAMVAMGASAQMNVWENGGLSAQYAIESVDSVTFGITSETPSSSTGKDGITPLLKIENDYWYISYDEGQTWQQEGKAKGEKGDKGDKGDTGEKGEKGDKGDKGDAMFLAFEQDGEYVYLTLPDSSKVKIAKVQDTPSAPNEDDVIEFKDLAVKSALLNTSPKIDTNGDGEISYKEAKAYKGRIYFSENATIRSFKEFQYFTGTSSCYFNKNSKLFEIVLPDGLDSIRSNAFEGVNLLTNITIPTGCTYIGSHAFYQCTKLADNIRFSEGLEYIGSEAFYGLSFTSISLPNTVNHIGDRAFYNSSSYNRPIKLQEFRFPESFVSGGKDIFYYLPFTIYWDAINCPVYRLSNSYYSDSIKTSVIFGDKVEIVPAELCYNLGKITEIILPTSVKTIGENAFYSCSSLSNVEFPEGLELINERAFYYCTSLQNITIPDKVQIIGSSAFSGCSKVTSITIGKSVEIINDYAFSSTNPTKIYCKAQHAPYIGTSALPTTAIIYVPRESVNEYREAWSDYATKIMGYDFE